MYFLGESVEFESGLKCLLAGPERETVRGVEAIAAIDLEEVREVVPISVAGKGLNHDGKCFLNRINYLSYNHHPLNLNEKNLLLSQDLYIYFTSLPDPNYSRFWLNITIPLLFLVV